MRVPSPRYYLMCPPRYFDVNYVINPWMDLTVPVDGEKAMAQWTTLRDTYRELGHSVDELPPQPGLPDMVFAANTGLVIDGRVLGARFHAEQRAAEADHARRWFVEQGYRDVTMPAQTNEAEGDLLWTGDTLLAGFGFRTVLPAHAEAQETFGVPVVSLRLADPSYYHLDTALFVLNETAGGVGAEIAYYPEAFTPGSRRVLERMFPNAVLGNADDAQCLGLNALSDGRNVVLPREATHLADQVAARGYEPIPVDISELRKAGGGPKCCTLEIRK